MDGSGYLPSVLSALAAVPWGSIALAVVFVSACTGLMLYVASRVSSGG